MDLFAAMCFLTVADSGPGRRQLDVAALQHLYVAHRVIAKLRILKKCARREKAIRDILLKFPIHNVREYFELAVGVRSKSCVRLYAIFVDDAKRAELFVSPALIPSSSISGGCMTCASLGRTYDAKQNVWNVFSQP